MNSTFYLSARNTEPSGANISKDTFVTGQALKIWKSHAIYVIQSSLNSCILAPKCVFPESDENYDLRTIFNST